MAEPDFEVGKFYKYRATDGIHLGFIDTSQGGYPAKKDEVIEYDGTTVVLKDKREFTDVPQLRGAIRQGWFVLEADVDAVYRPKSAGIEVRGTEQRGRDKPQKYQVHTHRAEEDAVGSVAARKADRERRFVSAVQRPPLSTEEAVSVVPGSYLVDDTDLDIVEWASGNEEVDEIAAAIDEAMQEWAQKQLQAAQDEALFEQLAEQRDAIEEAAEEYEADLLSLLNSIESPSSKPKASKPVPKTAPQAKPKATRTAAPLTPTAEPAVTVGSPKLKMPVERQERLQMPVHRADETENLGEVVTTVQAQRKMAVEREQEVPLQAAPAKPQSPKPPPRFGGAGVMVVDDDQMDMGKIALSQNNAAGNVPTAETAKAKPASTEGIQMGSVEVGRKKMATPIREAGDDGVVVGKILSPTRQAFTATEANTNSAAIKRTAQGKQLKVEHYEQPQTKTTSIATGDVEEAREGETLEELLPDAVSPPKPAPKVYTRPEDNPTYQAIKMLVPDFEWNMDRPVSQRVADAMKYVKNPQYMKGIIMIETDVAKEQIKARLAETLKGQKPQKPQKSPKSEESEEPAEA